MGAWTRRRVSAIAGVGMLVGCHAPARPRADAPTVIESDAPAWAPGHGGVVADSPSLTIGGLADVVDALRLRDGRVVIARSDPAMLSYFGADGRHLYDAGGPEDGPEALQRIARVSLAADDSVAVYDFGQSALILFNANGGRATTHRIEPSGVPRGVNGLLPKGLAFDGRYLFQSDETPYPFPGGAGAVVPDSARLYWVNRDGGLTDSTAHSYEGEIFGFEAKSAGGATTLLPLARPLGATLRVASGNAGVWTGDGRAWELRHLDPHGAIDRTVRLRRPLDPLTPAFKAEFVARFRARRLGTDPRGLDRQFAARIDAAPFPAELPAFNDLFIAADSVLWVQHTGLLEGRAGDGTLVWTLIGADGHWLGDLTMPPFFRPTAAGKGWMLGVLSPADGAMQVRLYPLQER